MAEHDSSSVGPGERRRPQRRGALERLEISALAHPDRVVRRMGFDLTHPYVEQCWGAVIGPSAVMALRRLPFLWAEREPALVDADALARSLGIGNSSGAPTRFARTLDRLSQFRLATWIDTDHAIGVYTQVPPVSRQRMERLPLLTRRAHAQLLAENRYGDPVPHEPQDFSDKGVGQAESLESRPASSAEQSRLATYAQAVEGSERVGRLRASDNVISAGPAAQERC